MKSREWFLEQDVKTTPDQRILSQQHLDSIRGFLSGLGGMLNDNGLASDLVVTPWDRGPTVTGVNVERTYEGGYVVTLPLTHIAATVQISEAMAPLCDFVSKMPFINFNSNEAANLGLTLKKVVLRGNAKRFNLGPDEAAESERLAGLKPGSVSFLPGRGERALDEIFWGKMPDAERCELLRQFVDIRERRLPPPEESPWRSIAISSLAFTAEHEAAHVWFGHFDILADITCRNRSTPLRQGPPSTSYVLAHEMWCERITSQSGWPSTAATEYCGSWSRVKEFQADWMAFLAITSKGLSSAHAKGEVETCVGVLRAALWGVFLSLSLVFLHEAVQTRFGMASFDQKRLEDPSGHPDAITRLQVLIARMVEQIPFQLDWRLEAFRFLRVVNDVAHHLDWEPFRALGGVVDGFIQTGGIESGAAKWVRILQHFDCEAVALGPEWLRRTGRDDDETLKSHYERMADAVREASITKKTLIIGPSWKQGS